MNSQFLGTIQPFAFGFAPQGWAPCNGQLLQVTENTALYDLLGTKYGGDGTTTFGLPKLAPLGPNGPGYYIALQGVFPDRAPS
jgi:microcystin-dependent protein